MGGHRTPRYKTRDGDNVMLSLRDGFHTAAFEYAEAIKVLGRDFACQRRTAANMLNDVIDAGELLMLSFLENGALWKAENLATNESTELDSFPRFVRVHYTNTLAYTANPTGGQTPASGNSGLAFPEVFATWLAQHEVEVANEKARREQERKNDIAQTLADHPALAPLHEFGQRWIDHADTAGKLPPVRISVFQSGSNLSFVNIDLRGKRADKAAADLLAVLEKHFPMRDPKPVPSDGTDPA